MYPRDVLTTDLVEIHRLGTRKEAENLHFRRYLSAHHHRIEELQRIAGAVEREIDCTACANCCRHSIVRVTGAEIASIAAHLQMDPAEAEHRYTEPDSEDSACRVLRSSRNGCVFLDGNLCSIYEHRPKACRDFPNLHLGTHSLGGRVSSLCRWAALCPIIYNAIEIYKHQVGYHRVRPSPASGSSGCER
jgi:Fe-S-cluster containining protein